MYEDKISKHWNDECIAQFIDKVHDQVSYCQVIQVMLKLFCFKPGAYLFPPVLYFN